MKINDNSRLKELIKDKGNPEVRREILDVLYDSRLLLPVVFRKCRNPDDLAGQFGFDVVDIPDGYGEMTVPLFTSLSVAESNPLKCTAIEIAMGNLAELLKQSDKYSSVTINIFTQHYIDLPLDEFLAIFGIVANHKIKDIENGKLRQMLQNDFSEDELYSELKDLPLISPWIDEESGQAHEFTYDKNDNEYFPLFTDLDEFEKVFENDREVYPQAYTFSRAAELTREDMVINPASESVFINRKDMLKRR